MHICPARPGCGSCAMECNGSGAESQLPTLRGKATPHILTLEGDESLPASDGDGSAAASATRTAEGLDATMEPAPARRPTTPHPDDMAPPPPPGEPPWLLSHKRPHGMSVGGLARRAATEANGSSAGPIALDGEGLQSAVDAPDRVPAVCARDSSAGSSAPSVPASAEQHCLETEDELFEMEGLTKPACDAMMTEGASAEMPPGLPPGPPPAEMAPPPPLGPPPSLPLERAELKRSSEEPAGSPMGKRLRFIPQPRGPAAGPGVSEGESSETGSSTAEDTPPGSSSMPGGTGPSASLDASYVQSPPSARWVWDRLLQQDGRCTSTAIVERHMLSALDGLRFGTDSGG